MENIKNSRILVTGGSGSIGTYLIEMLDKSNKILNIDIKNPLESSRKKSSFKKINLINHFELNNIISTFKPDILFHMAAVFQRTAETLDFRHDCFNGNLIGMQNTFEACVNNNVKQIIFPSSYLIYDENQYLFKKKDLDKPPVRLNENSPINPRNLTGIAKLYGERELEFYSEMGIITTSLRIFRVYGPQNVDIIDRWIRSILSGEKIIYFGEEQAFDYVHAKDVAKACLKAAIMKQEGVFNVGSGIPVEVNMVLNILKNIFGKDLVLIKKEPDDFIRFEKSFADLTKSNKLLEYFPEILIEDGIKLNIDTIRNETK